MRKGFNRFTNAAVLYLEGEHLSLHLANGEKIEGREIADLSSLEKQPVLLVINPLQFLQVHQQLHHLYLTRWQEEILLQLLTSSVVISAVLFLPHLIPSFKKPLRLIYWDNQKYLEICQDGVVFWNQLEGDHLSQQLHEASFYLRRHQLDIKTLIDEESVVPVTISSFDLLTGALQKPTFRLQSEEFPLIEKLMHKQNQTRRYQAIIAGLVMVIGGSSSAGFFFLWLGVQTFLNHNPWKLVQTVKALPAAERDKLLKFKEFMKFQSRSPSFSAVCLKKLFQQFPGKIVATDMVWQKGEWTIAFIINPAFVAQIPEIKEWMTQNLKNSKLMESESAIHQYTLQFIESRSA